MFNTSTQNLGFNFVYYKCIIYLFINQIIKIQKKIYEYSYKIID